jgi:hypothetical protein
MAKCEGCDSRAVMSEPEGGVGLCKACAAMLRKEAMERMATLKLEPGRRGKNGHPLAYHGQPDDYTVELSWDARVEGWGVSVMCASMDVLGPPCNRHLLGMGLNCLLATTVSHPDPVAAGCEAHDVIEAHKRMRAKLTGRERAAAAAELDEWAAAGLYGFTVAT